MPFKSAAQMRYMFSKHPKIANRWRKETKAKGGKFPKGKSKEKKK